jgi:adenine deaminase
MRLHLTADERRALIEVALGAAPADLVVSNARLLNVYTGEWLPGHAVAVSGERIAYVGPEARFAVGPRTQLVDAEGQALVPGLVDGHTHLLSRYGVEEFVRYAAPGGTTTVVTELIELASVVGLQGITSLLEALADQPITFFGTLPPLAGLAPFVETVAPPLDAYRRLLARDDVLGLGEVYWGNLLRGDRRLLELVAETQRTGKLVQGHAAGAKGQRLAAYVAAGVHSDHEPITADEGLERLRLGLHWMAREGEIRRDLEVFAPLWREHRVELRRLILATDSVGPRRLLEQGYLEHVVRRAIKLGVPPEQAIQAATLNVAEHYRLDHLLGGIAPGRWADLVLLLEVPSFRPSAVIARGKLIARDGELLGQPRQTTFPKRMLNSIRRPRLFRPDDFVVSGNGSAQPEVRAVEMVTHLVTREATAQPPARDGQLVADPRQDLAKLAAFNRSGRSADGFVGFVRGFGLERGALATSMCWDSQCLIVIGVDDRDMAHAACRLLDSQGGATVFANGELLAEFQAPVGGIISQAPLPDIVAELEEVEQALRHLGTRLEDPLLAADVMTTAAIPHLRVTERGYVRVRDGELLGLWEG